MTTVVFCFVFLVTVALPLNAANGPRLRIGFLPPIVGGDPTDMINYPYQAELQRSGRHHCGGSIISEEYILTAAHCLKNYSLDTIQVRVGSSEVGQGGQLSDVSEEFIHEEYNATIFDYDVAVLKLTNKIKINNKTTKVVKLADSGSSLAPGEYIKIAGWGKIMEGGPYSNVLRAVELPVLPPEKCEAAYKGTTSKFTTHMFCAGFPEGGKDSCIGDSGGPAVHKETLVQYGIVSWGRGCARGRFPGVYTAVPVVRGWIKQIAGL